MISLVYAFRLFRLFSICSFRLFRLFSICSFRVFRVQLPGESKMWTATADIKKLDMLSRTDKRTRNEPLSWQSGAISVKKYPKDVTQTYLE